MLNKNRLLINGGMAAVQVIVTGVVFLLLYPFLYQSIGIDDMGVWSVVLAWAQVNHLANLGMTGSAVKYVSMYQARGDTAQVRRVIQTSVVSVAVALAAMLAITFPLLHWVVAFFIEPVEKVPAALSILPYALLSFWLAAIGGVLQACIDGFQRVDLRNILVMSAAVIYLVLAFILVPKAGLIGLAQAQVIQTGALCVTAWLVVRYLHRSLPLLPVRWHRGTFMEMLRYSLTFQGMSFAQMLFEPVTKSLLSKFGGTTAAGLFEGANKIAVQVRALITTTHYAVVPTIADLQERNPKMLRTIYRTSFRLILFLVIPALPLLIALTPFFSHLYFDTVEPTFILFAVLIFIGWFLNLFSSPAYFDNMGTGALRWNMWDHVVAGVLNTVLGVLLGFLFGGTGVVIAFSVAILAGSTVLVVAYHREHHIRLSTLIRREDLLLALASLFGLGAVVLLYFQLQAIWKPIPLAVFLAGGYLAVIAVPLWHHSLRRQVQGWITSLLQRNRLREHVER